MRRLAGLGLAVLLVGCNTGAVNQSVSMVEASDGKPLFFHEGRPAGKARGVVVLFHQAEGSSGEYLQISPVLNEKGFITVAVDQRSGGDKFGANQTVKEHGKSSSYEEAYPDFEGALTLAQGYHVPIVVWGSSYSASMVFKIAGEHPEVAAVVAFSPGEYFDRPLQVSKEWFPKVKCPVFVASGEGDKETGFASEACPGAKVHWHPGGQHGSTSLYSGAADAYWADVDAFLDKVCPKAGDAPP